MQNIVGTLLLIAGVFQSSHTADLVCYQGSRSNFESAPLDNPTPLINSGSIDLAKKSMIFAFGFQGNSDGPAVTAIVDTFLMDPRVEWNVMLLNWTKEAGAGFSQLAPAIGYVLHAVPNAYTVGQKYGEALIALAGAGMNMDQTYLVGHSLGAHVSGFAGRVVKNAGHEVGRVIGLDPAGNIFQTEVTHALDETCGAFVQAIHTDPSGMGTSKKSGHVDVWANHGPEKMLQPGCPQGNYPMFSKENMCSHNRAWELLCETVEIPDSVIAAPAPNYQTWVDTDGSGTPKIVVGMDTDTTARGNHYFSTNAQSPFGKFENGAKP